ncbi:MAG: hypothetical protein RBT49_03805 [Bacteroidales bacterium]|jgi:phenylacetate-CoA ligase|nr:hypothetical protein [Bacteroidales bacterium]
MNKKDLAFYFIGKKYNFDIRSYYSFVLENQYWDNEKIQEFQFERIKNILNHAQDNVPHYNDLFSKIGFKPNYISDIDDLKKLPILRKGDINKDFNSFLSKDFKQYNPVDRYTGGTTGSAFHLYNDMNSWAVNWATKIRTFSWGGYNFGTDRLGVMAGGSLLPTKKMSPKSMLWRYINNYYSMPITQMNDDLLDVYVKNIIKQKLKFLRGYPSAIYTLALFMNEKGITIPLNAIFTTAEMLHEHQRLLIEERFGCKCFDQYGCADGMGGANECDHHNGLHVNIETSFMEIVDSNGNEVGDNEEGEVVLTSFNDRAMPLIRYAPGDYAIKSTEQCSCGRTLPMIKKIIGRTSDLIELSNGIKLNGLSIPFEAWSDKIERFQIIQTREDAVEVVLIKKEGFSEKDEKQVIEMMNFNCGKGIDIKVKYVNEIPLPKSGKFRYVISLVK